MHGALRTWCNCDCECAAEKKAVTFLVHSHFAIVFAIFVHIVLVHGYHAMVYLVSVRKLLEIDPWLLQWVLLSFGGASQCSAETKVIFDALDILHGVIAWEVAEYKTKVINNTLRGSLMSQQTVNKGMLRDIWWDLRIACDCTSSIRTK